MSGANLFAAAHFYWLTCESNEHREGAKRIRGGVRASDRRETKDRRKASRTACSQVAFFFGLHVSQTNTEKEQSGFEVAFVLVIEGKRKIEERRHGLLAVKWRFFLAYM